MTAARIAAIVAFASVFQAWVFVAIGEITMSIIRSLFYHHFSN
jgi:hypothetical protein